MADNQRTHSAASQSTTPVILKRGCAVYQDGLPVRVGSDGDGDSKDASEPVKSEEVVFVLQNSSGGYFVYTLSEIPDENSASAFKLSELSAQSLPRELLDARLLSNTPEHLLEDAHHCLHVIVSTKSGLCQAHVFFNEVLGPLLGALGLSAKSSTRKTSAAIANDVPGYHTLITESADAIREFAQNLHSSMSGSGDEAKASSQHTIVLLSGDGGVVDLLNSVPEKLGEGHQPPIVSVLPLGTGNALFHSLHKPLYQTAAKKAGTEDEPGDNHGRACPSEFILGLRTLFFGRPAPLPSFLAEFSPGSRLVLAASDEKKEADTVSAATLLSRSSRHTETGPTTLLGPPVSQLRGGIVASYGFHASLVWESDTPEYRVHGAKRFGMAAAELLKLGHAYDCAVAVRRGGGQWERLGRDGEPFSYVLATLVSSLEKTFTISPASRPLDGRLRLVSFGDVGGEKTMKIMMEAYQEGKHVGMSWERDGKEETIGYDEIDEVKVTIREIDPRWRKVCVDGTIVELEQDGWIVVKKEARAKLNVLVDGLVLS